MVLMGWLVGLVVCGGAWVVERKGGVVCGGGVWYEMEENGINYLEWKM